MNELTLEEVTYKRAKKNTYASKKDKLANLERVIIEHKLDRDDLSCKEYGEHLVEMGVKSRKEIIKYVPAKLIVEEHVIYSYACKACKKEIGVAKEIGVREAAVRRWVKEYGTHGENAFPEKGKLRPEDE